MNGGEKEKKVGPYSCLEEGGVGKKKRRPVAGPSYLIVFEKAERKGKGEKGEKERRIPQCPTGHIGKQLFL